MGNLEEMEASVQNDILIHFMGNHKGCLPGFWKFASIGLNPGLVANTEEKVEAVMTCSVSRWKVRGPAAGPRIPVC